MQGPVMEVLSAGTRLSWFGLGAMFGVTLGVLIVALMMAARAEDGHD